MAVPEFNIRYGKLHSIQKVEVINIIFVVFEE
jgi:hypothetical protein